MKKRLCVLLIVITLCSLAACGAAATSASEQTPPALPGGNAAADKRADASPNGGAYTAAAFGDGDRRTGSDRHERHHALYDDL